MSWYDIDVSIYKALDQSLTDVNNGKVKKKQQNGIPLSNSTGDNKGRRKLTTVSYSSQYTAVEWFNDRYMFFKQQFLNKQPHRVVLLAESKDAPMAGFRQMRRWSKSWRRTYIWSTQTRPKGKPCLLLMELLFSSDF